MNTQVYKAVDRALHGISDDLSHEISLRLDSAGFITAVSPNAELLGIDLEAQLLMPHIADLADADCRAKVASYFVEVIAGECGDRGVEFPLANPRAGVCEFDQEPQALSENDASRSWYCLRLACTQDPRTGELGASGTLRIIARNPTSARKAQQAAMSDPFTGLADRRSFVSILIGSIAMNNAVSIAVFAIDGMRSIYMQYGQGTADEIRWGFARFLETMTEAHHCLAQIDDERFGVIIPGARPGEAREWADDALRIFEALAVPSSGSKPQFSASAGIARGELSAEWTIRQAELGLVMARAAGGMQTAICRPHSGLSNGRHVKNAMDQVVKRAVRRVP